MADLERLQDALIKADAAGDTEGAKLLADEIRRIQSLGSQTQEQPVQPQTTQPQQLSQPLDNKTRMANLSQMITAPVNLNQEQQMKVQDTMNRNVEQGLFVPRSQVVSNITGQEQVQKEDEENAFTTGLSTAGTILSSAVAEPIAGLAGLAATTGTKIGNFLGLTDKEASAVGTDVINSVREAVTINPNAGAQEVLGKVAETIEAVTPDALKGSQKRTGEFFAEIGEDLFGEEGRAIGGAFGETLFEGLTIAGGAGAGKALGKGIDKASEVAKNKVSDISKRLTEKTISNKEAVKELREALPTAQDFKTKSNEIFKQIEEKGISIENTEFADLNNKIFKDISVNDLDPDLTPKSTALVRRINNTIESGNPVTVGEIENIRKLAGEIGRDINNPSDARIANIISNKVDELYDDITPKVGSELKEARGLWKQKLKSDTIDEMMNKAELQASGFENGMRVQMRSILNNKKKRQLFTPAEQRFMRDVVKGDAKSNVLKLLGKFGIAEGSSSNILGTGASIAAGNLLAGGAGAVIFPLIGQSAKVLAQKATKNNIDLANDIIRAGDNAVEVTKTYLKNTPKDKRSTEDLTALLINNKIKSNTISELPDSIPEVSKAKKFLKLIDDIAQQDNKKGLAGILATQVEDEEGGLNIEISKKKGDN